MESSEQPTKEGPQKLWGNHPKGTLGGPQRTLGNSKNPKEPKETCTLKKW